MSLIGRLVTRPEATHADAEASGHAGVWIYHRAGCPFCAKLTLALRGKAKQARWVDIWADPEAAAYLRTVNDGNETVPTVVVDGVPRTNPPPAEVKAAIASGGWR